MSSVYLKVCCRSKCVHYMHVDIFLVMCIFNFTFLDILYSIINDCVINEKQTLCVQSIFRYVDGSYN